MKRIIRNQKVYIVLFNEIIKISMIFNDDLSIDRNFLFESQCNAYLNQNDDVFVYIIDANMFFVQVHNTSNSSIILSRRARLNLIMKYNQQKCYQFTMNEIFKIVYD